jgi:hypothetical protein
VDDAARCHCRIRPVHFRVRGERGGRTRVTTAGTVSNSVRCTTYRLEKSSRTCFTCPVIEIQGVTETRYTSRVKTSDLFSSDLPAIIGFNRLPFKPQAATSHQTLRSVSYLRASHHYE